MKQQQQQLTVIAVAAAAAAVLTNNYLLNFKTKKLLNLKICSILARQVSQN